MAQKTQQRSGGGNGEEHIEIDVTIHGNYIGKVKVKKGAKISEILEAVRERAAELGIHLGDISTYNILLNDQDVKVTQKEDGTLEVEEDAEIAADVVLVLSQRIIGGIA